MSDNHLPPDSSQLPAPRPGPPPSHALAMPGQYGLGMPMDPRHAEDDDDDVIDLRDLWRIVVKHKWMIISMAVAGLLAALLLSFVRTPLYLATATVQVDKRAASVVSFGQDATGEMDLDDRTGLGTQLELLKSRVLAERVIDQLGLDRQGRLPQLLPSEMAAALDDDSTTDAGWAGALTGLLGKMQDSWSKMRQPAADNVEQLGREQVYAAFRRSVQMEIVRNTRLIKVNVENASPQLAARIANAVTDSFISLNLERRLEASSYAKGFLETQLTLTKARLEESERALHQYAREHNILTLDEKTDVSNQTFTEFAAALAKAEQERIKAEAEYEAVRRRPDTARHVLESTTIQSYKTERRKLDAEYQENAKIYKDEFPKMLQLRAQMQDLDGKIQAEIASILASLQNQLSMTQRQEGSLRTRLEQTRKQIMAGQDQGVDYNLLKREVDTNRELYNGLLQQVKEVGVAGGVESNNIQVVDKAETPLFPYKPKVQLNGAIGLLAGLILGLGLVFLREALDDSIKFVDDVEKTLMVPLLGVIPQVRTKDIRGGNLAMLPQIDPRGHFAEAYRSLRTALQFSTSDGAPRRLLVTSTAKNEGKTTTALALATNFAQLGLKTVLIDADMRNPTAHKYLGMANNKGLSTYLSGHCEMNELVLTTPVQHLGVITGGPVPPSPVDLLTGPRLGELLDRLQAAGVAFIIVDGPPVLGLADALVLGNQVPDVLYVAQASHTRKSHIKDAFRRLRMAGIVPRGVVLTKTSSQNTAYYTYDNYYGYGDTKTTEPQLSPVAPVHRPATARA